MFQNHVTHQIGANNVSQRSDRKRTERDFVKTQALHAECKLITIALETQSQST